MAEKGGRPAILAGTKPISMKLFSSWEVDRTPPNCIPRLCSLTLSRLVVVKPLGSDMTSILIAVKMQSSKRTLRSNEILLPSTGLLDTELDLTFSLQYPHFLKREGNKLHIMLQRRKKYKNRTFLGFKTLAEGSINMSQVLQRQMDLELDLYSEGKEKSTISARVTMMSLISQPVDHEADIAVRQKHLSLGESSDRAVVDYSDDEEDYSTNEDGSDSEPLEDGGVSRRTRKSSRGKIRVAESRVTYGSAVQQRNLKQKFIALLKRFKVTDDLQVLGPDHDEIQKKLTGSEMDPAEIEDLFDELDDLSDSGPEMDTMSITSTPKPSLRPFFSSSRSLLHETLNVPGVHLDKPGSDRMSDESSKKADSDSHPENWTDHEHSDPQQLASSPPRSLDERSKAERSSVQDIGEKKNKLFTRDKSTISLKEKKPIKEKSSVERSNSALQIESSPRKVVLEQLSRLLPPDDTIPDHVILVNTGDPQGPLLAAKLQERQQRVLCTAGSADVRATITCLVNKIQKFCNSNAKAPPPIKVLVAGSDSYVNSVLRPYVDQLSSKPPDWQAYIKFFIVPLGSNSLAKYLGSIDTTYANTFVVEGWRELLEKAEIQKTDCQEMVNRINRYLNNTASVLHLPVAEAMVTYKEKCSEDESSQVFIPFINDVRIGSLECSTSLSVEIDDSQMGMVPTTGSSPPSQSSQAEKSKERITPPSSPNINSSYLTSAREQPMSSSSEPLELQLDYWLVAGRGESSGNKKGESTKSSLKSTFRSLQVQRLALLGDAPSQNFIMSYCVKEKKQKIMRLGKKKEKEKENDPKSQMVDGVSRLICLAKTQNTPLKVGIDSVEWSGVKFFQLSSQWQTHIKHFPVALFTYADTTL